MQEYDNKALLRWIDYDVDHGVTIVGLNLYREQQLKVRRHNL